MDTLETRRHQDLWQQAVAQAIKQAAQTGLEPGMLVVYINDLETVFEIVISGQTHAKIKLFTDTGSKEEQTHTVALDELIHINDIMGNYWRLAKNQ